MKFLFLTSATVFFALIALCCTFEAFFYGYHWLSKKYNHQIDDNHLCQKYLGNILGAWFFITLTVVFMMKVSSLISN